MACNCNKKKKPARATAKTVTQSRAVYRRRLQELAKTGSK